MSILPKGGNLTSPIESITSNARTSPKGASKRDERTAAFGKQVRRLERVEVGCAEQGRTRDIKSKMPCAGLAPRNRTSHSSSKRCIRRRRANFCRQNKRSDGEACRFGSSSVSRAHCDVLIVWKLDRLGRTMTGLIEFAVSSTDRGLGLRSFMAGINTVGTAGKLVIHILHHFGARDRLLRAMNAAAQSCEPGRPDDERTFGFGKW